MPSTAPDRFVLPPPALSAAGRLTVLAAAFLGWLGAGVHMALTQQTGRAASIDLLGRAGAIDGERFRDLSAQAELAKKGKAEPLDADDAAQMKAWEVPVGRWFAWDQCAFLFG